MCAHRESPYIMPLAASGTTRRRIVTGAAGLALAFGVGGARRRAAAQATPGASPKATPAARSGRRRPGASDAPTESGRTIASRRRPSRTAEPAPGAPPRPGPAPSTPTRPPEPRRPRPAAVDRAGGDPRLDEAHQLPVQVGPRRVAPHQELRGVAVAEERPVGERLAHLRLEARHLRQDVPVVAREERGGQRRRPGPAGLEGWDVGHRGRVPSSTGRVGRRDRSRRASTLPRRTRWGPPAAGRCARRRPCRTHFSSVGTVTPRRAAARETSISAAGSCGSSRCGAEGPCGACGTGVLGPHLAATHGPSGTRRPARGRPTGHGAVPCTIRAGPGWAVVWVLEAMSASRAGPGGQAASPPPSRSAFWWRHGLTALDQETQRRPGELFPGPRVLRSRPVSPVCGATRG